MMGHAFLKNSFLATDPEKKKEYPGGAVPVCFNGAKSWRLGQFDEQYQYNFTAGNIKWEVKLIGQVDYPQLVQSDVGEFKVILTLTNATKDYYVMFHRVPG